MTHASNIAHDYTLEEAGRLEPLFVATTVMVVSLAEVAAIADGSEEPNYCALFAYGDSIRKIVRENNGSLLQASAGCITACFYLAQDAVRSASRIQDSVDRRNLLNAPSDPVLVRIGLHTAPASVWQQNPERDVAAVAKCCASIAHGGEIVLSEETRDSLLDGDEVHSLFLQTVALQEGSSRRFNLYNGIWKPTEVEVDLSRHPKPEGDAVKRTMLPTRGRAAIVLLCMLACYLLVKAPAALQRIDSEKKRLIHQRVALPTEHRR